MGASDFFTFASWALYVAVFFLTAARAIHRRQRADIEVALFFGTAALIILTSVAATALGPGAIAYVAPLSGTLIMMLPYLLLRLVANFTDVRRWVMRGTEAGLACSVLVLFGLEAPLPAWAIVALLAYFGVTMSYASVSFVREARRTQGVTRRRMQAAAFGSACVGLDILMAGMAALYPPAALTCILFGALCGLASGVSYYVGFTPPVWLHRAWQEPALRTFMGGVTCLTRLSETSAFVGELEQRAAAALGASHARLGLWVESEQAVRFFSAQASRIETSTSGSDGGLFVLPPDRTIALRAFNAQQASFTADAARGDTLDALYFRSVGIRAVLAAPVIAADRRLGVLAMYSARPSIFVCSDVSLLALLADHIGVLIENRDLQAKAALISAAEETNRLKDEFLATVSHDLRNPLTAILGTAQVVGRWLDRSGVVERDRLAAAVATIESSALQMNGLIDGLLDAACLQMDRVVDIRPREMDLVVLTGRMVNGLTSASDCHPIRLSSTPERIEGVWDAARLERVLQNLLGNAMKYSPSGGEIGVQLWCEQRDARKWAVLSVTDHGLGIPPSDLARIFERFHRGSNVSATIAGTGIGLAVSLQVIEQHGGTISADSREGEGSTFVVRLPLVLETSGNSDVSADRQADAEPPPLPPVRHVAALIGEDIPAAITAQNRISCGPGEHYVRAGLIHVGRRHPGACQG